MIFLPNRPRSRTRVVLVRRVLVYVIAAGVYVATAAAQSQDIATLRKQAKSGDAEAQYVLAQSYLTGVGIPKDPKQGLEWLRKAADQDHPPAQLALWVMYREGFRPADIPKDPKQGLKWLQRSADHGYATAEHSLGLLYLNGDDETGIPRKPHEAAIWLLKAARQPNSTQSQAALQEMLKKGLITKQEANWHAAEPTRVVEKRKPAPFSLAEIETGLKNWITSKRMAALVQQFGVNFKLNPAERKRLQDAGAEESLLTVISLNKRS
jgi:hypothetical protein